MRPILLAVLLACLGAPLAAQDRADRPAIVVRQSVEPATGAVIGQHVALLVDVLFRDGMQHPPRVNLPAVAGLQVLRFETQGTGRSETVAGDTYAGQQFEFALYPRRGGAFAIPPAAVTLLDRDGGTLGTAQGQPVTLSVVVPPGVDASAPVAATRSLTLDQQWAPAPNGALKAGDAIVRTIARTAEDVPALAMRDLAFTTPDGVRAYTDPPDIDDHQNRGVVTGRRIDRVTYVFERSGHFALPAVTQPWWNLGSETLESAKGAGIAIDVAAPPPAAAAAVGWRLPVAGVAALLVLAVLAVTVRPALRRWRASDARVERAAFAALRRACAGSGADARVVWRAFARWRSVLAPGRRDDATLAAAPLDAAVFAGDASAWDEAGARTFLHRLSQLRRSHHRAVQRAVLPPLNP